MRITKPLIITALVAGSLLVLDGALFAQNTTNTPPPSPPPAGNLPPRGGPPGGSAMRGPQNADMLERQLNLTADQKPKVQAIIETRMQKMQDLRQNPDFAKLSPQERIAKMQAIQEEMATKMKAVLTPEQFGKWQNMTSRGRPMRPPPGRENARGTNAPVPPPPGQPPQK